MTDEEKRNMQAQAWAAFAAAALGGCIQYVAMSDHGNYSDVERDAAFHADDLLREMLNRFPNMKYKGQE